MSPATGERDQGWHWPRWALGLTSGPYHLTGQVSISFCPLKCPSSLNQNPTGVRGCQAFHSPPRPQPQTDTPQLLTCEHAPDDGAHTRQEVCEGPGEGQGRSAGTLLPAGPGPSVPRPSPVLLCQLHHHGRELVEHEDPGKPLIAHQPVGNLLMSGHRELIRPQHLAQEGRLGRGQVCDPAPSPAAPAPVPAPGLAVP